MMPQFQEDTTIRTVFEIINSGGMERIREAIIILIYEAMKAKKVFGSQCPALGSHRRQMGLYQWF